MTSSRSLFTALPAAALLAAALFAGPAFPQAAHTPPPDHALVGVRLGLGDDAPTATLVLRGGRIESVLAADAEPPPGVRVVEAEGLVALPAFVDAFTTAGVPELEPEIDLDDPLDTGRDVRADMRLANRKGIAPSRAVVDEVELSDERLGEYREAGFGVALQAPDGELLGGRGALVALRDAALRDRVLLPHAWQHAAWDASGGGYPNTLMAYHAQLRQFAADCARHSVLLARAADGRPGPRPPYDAELAAGAALSGGEPILAAARDPQAARRWLRLGDELGWTLGLRITRDAGPLAAELAATPRPVVLTLDWGDEPDDPRPDAEDDDEGEEDSPEGEGDAGDEDEAPPEVEGVDLVDGPREATQEPEEAADADEPSEHADDHGDEGDEDEGDDEVDRRFVYTVPYGVRLAERLEWERLRDGALALHAGGVPFALGTDDAKPDELLDRVRALVEEGLPAQTALDALTVVPARWLGLEGRVGALDAGADATLALWSADPFTDEDAEVEWLFVDGYPWEPAPEAAGTGRERRWPRDVRDHAHDHPHTETELETEAVR